MVAWRETRMDRIARVVGAAGLPGEEGDWRQVAAGIAAVADELDPGGEDELLEMLLLESQLRCLGASVTPSGDERLEDLSALIAAGAGTPELWCLVRGRILRYRGTPLGRAPRWEIDGAGIAPLMSGLYEMGEQQLCLRLAEILSPLVRARDGDMEIRIREESAEARRRWSAGLRQCLKNEGLPCRWEPLILSV